MAATSDDNNVNAVEESPPPPPLAMKNLNPSAISGSGSSMDTTSTAPEAVLICDVSTLSQSLYSHDDEDDEKLGPQNKEHSVNRDPGTPLFADPVVVAPVSSPDVDDSDCEPAYDDDDDSDNDNADHHNDRVDWRHDPTQSHSDYTIEIVTAQQVQTSKVEIYYYSKQQKSSSSSSSNQQAPTSKTNDSTITSPSYETVRKTALHKNQKVTTYHVHKRFLTSGRRRSEYFVRLLHQGATTTTRRSSSDEKTNNESSSEKNDNADNDTSNGGKMEMAVIPPTPHQQQHHTMRLEVDARAANAFPILLDYLYSTNQQQHQHEPYTDYYFTAENVTSLYALAKLLDMKRLRWEAKQYFQKDIYSSHSCGTYYEYAKNLEDEKLLAEATRACHANMMELSTSSRLLQVTDVGFWIDYMQSKKESGELTTKLSRKLSKLIAAYTLLHRESLSFEQFERLTHPDLLTSIHADAALDLLELECILVLQSNNEPTSTSIISSPPNDEDQQPSLSSLQERCIQALARGWQTVDMSSDHAQAVLLHQSPLVLREILTLSVDAARSNSNSDDNKNNKTLSAENDGVRIKQQQQQQQQQQHKEGEEKETTSEPPVPASAQTAMPGPDPSDEAAPPIPVQVPDPVQQSRRQAAARAQKEEVQVTTVTSEEDEDD